MKVRYSDVLLEVGCDEAGRGCLSGPVFAAAVVLPDDFHHPFLNDSKKVSEKKRYILRDYIRQNALDWSIGIVDNLEIDKINILNASIKAMHIALDKLKNKIEFILVDGNKFIPYRDVPHKTIIKGDAIYAPIAAASILAKTYRDDYMIKLNKEFPNYFWDKNKGYPTKQHKQAVLEYGLSKYHRQKFCSFYYQSNIKF